jgi:hypothetical protein
MAASNETRGRSDEVWFFELYDDAPAVRAHEEGYALSEAALSIGPKVKELLAEPHTILQADLAGAKGAEVTP